MSKIIEHLGKESAWYLGPFMRTGKRGYELVHQTSILKRCNVTPIVDETPSAIEYFGNFRTLFLKCVEVGNVEAIYYEGLHRSTSLGVEEGIKVLDANVPKHGLSTLAVGIFYVCLGKEMEATNVFEEFAANHNLDLKSNVIFEMGDELQSRLWSFHLPLSNTYEKTFKFPEDDFLASPSCLYRHAHTMDLEGSCKNCRLFWVCLNISKLL
ncbi:hypothetical protein DY000_02029126 [Brassica cretica]|uniref:Pentatricopeptide repeat-containing protein n=1 Tax=Brassica cretica TaxID=69181 RepID=A0ABQ7DHU4_BRACR|nr:hypothetical protein DY000_02029126 [Brassica cretica]